jgi:transglutaminase-like putative cysteine protease
MIHLARHNEQPSPYSCVNKGYVIGLSNLLAIYNDSLENAIVINNYVCNINYQLYNSNVHNSFETLISFTGNCADQSNVLVELARIANLPARDVSGNKKIGSGSQEWGQILIDNIWICVDGDCKFLVGF